MSGAYANNERVSERSWNAVEANNPYFRNTDVNGIAITAEDDSAFSHYALIVILVIITITQYFFHQCISSKDGWHRVDCVSLSYRAYSELHVLLELGEKNQRIYVMLNTLRKACIWISSIEQLFNDPVQTKVGGTIYSHLLFPEDRT